MYVFGGDNNKTVERLDVSVETFPYAWDLLTLKGFSFLNPLVTVIQKDQILFFGGNSSKHSATPLKNFSLAYTFSTKTNTFE